MHAFLLKKLTSRLQFVFLVSLMVGRREGRVRGLHYSAALGGYNFLLPYLLRSKNYIFINVNGMFLILPLQFVNRLLVSLICRTYLKLPWKPLIFIDGSTVYELNDEFKVRKNQCLSTLLYV